MSEVSQVAKELLRRVPAGIGGVVVAIIVAVAAMTSWFTVDPEEKAVVLRFGEINRTVGQGMQFKMPFGIEREYKVPVLRQLKEEFGFRTTAGDPQSQFNFTSYDAESLMLTGDLNVADVEWVTQFTITDPEKYLFSYRVHDRPYRYNEAIMAFRDMNEAVMRQVIGDHTIIEVLTAGRSRIQSEVLIKLQNMCEEYDLGVRVDQVILQDINPPERVKPAFNEVNQAQQERERMINEANGEYNKEVPRSRGVADQKIQAAEGYALKRVNEALGDVARFNAQLGEYQKGPEVTRTRLYLESLKEVIPQLGRKIILDEDASQVLRLLQLNQEGIR